MLSNKELATLKELENKLAWGITDNLFENGLDAARTFYNNFISKLESDHYSKWVVKCLKERCVKEINALQL